MTMLLAPGKSVGRYQIISLIGSGGMGEVYRAHDAQLRRNVALKVLLGSMMQDAQGRARFEQEARAAGGLSHPNIIAIYDIGEQEGMIYIVSELLEGNTLRSALDAGGISVQKAIEYGIQIASGLGAAHDKGIVHRDLKPENVFLTKDGSVKLLDFG